MRNQFTGRVWPVLALPVLFSFYCKASSTVNPMSVNTDTLKNSTVKKAIDALQSGNPANWFALFTRDAALYDDGNKKNFRSFFEAALGHEYFTHIDKMENDGLDIYGRFHSDKWGNFKTYFRFYLDGEGRISRLDIGQADY
jgi:hypothetical protein